jgi:hypothetical protein
MEAVLETPYVPLTGQSPAVAPYEKTVRHVIYPDGSNTSSVVSQALQSRATNGYYFQATSSSQIATGFIALTDKLLFSVPYLTIERGPRVGGRRRNPPLSAAWTFFGETDGGLRRR